MRKVEEEVCTAFVLGESKTMGNTTSTGDTLSLHGNVIAKRENGRIYATLAGWPTPATRSRLNALCNIMGFRRGFWQEQGHQYFGARASYFHSIEPDQWVVLT
jgi:hypothetical protein